MEKYLLSPIYPTKDQNSFVKKTIKKRMSKNLGRRGGKGIAFSDSSNSNLNINKAIVTGKQIGRAHV